MIIRVISNNKCILIFKSHLIFVANPGGFSSKWAFTTKGDRGKQEVFTKQQQQPTTPSQAGGTCTQEDAECNGSEFGEPSSDSGRCCIWLLAPEMMMTMSLQAILMAASDLGPGSFPSLDSEEGTLTKRLFLTVGLFWLSYNSDIYQSKKCNEKYSPGWAKKRGRWLILEKLRLSRSAGTWSRVPSGDI